MLLDGANPYAGGLPEVLTLDQQDFEFAISAQNREAMGEMAEWAVVAYMAADCNLAAYMFDNLLQLKAAGSNRDVHVSVLFDGPLLTDSFFARLNPGTPLADDIVLRYRELRSAEASTLQMALQIAAIYPARRRLLLLSGHGSGWRGALQDLDLGMAYAKEGRVALPEPGAACDRRLHDCLVEAQGVINAAIERGAQASPTPRYDVLAFDACYMGSIEAIAHLADQAELLVVSEDMVPGEGFPYDALLDGLHRSPQQSPSQLAADLVADMKQRYSAAGGRRRSITLAALRSDQLKPFADLFLAFVQALGEAMDDAASLAAVRYGVEKAWSFGETGTIDIRGFVQMVHDRTPDARLKTAAEAVLGAWPGLVAEFAGGGTVDTTNGLSLYAPPPDAFDMAYVANANQLPLNFGIWSWFLGAYYLRILGAEAPSHPLIQAFNDTMHDLMARGIYPGTDVAEPTT